MKIKMMLNWLALKAKVVVRTLNRGGREMKKGVKKVCSALKVITWIAIGLGFLTLGCWLVWSSKVPTKIENLRYFLGGVCFISGIWTWLSIRIVGAKEMAVSTRLGEPVDFRNSGPCFVPYSFEKLIKYPKKTYNFLYKDKEVVTKEEKDKKHLGSQVLIIDIGVYLNFPREQRKKSVYMTSEELKAAGLSKDSEEKEEKHPLIKILEGDIPIKEESLKTWVEEEISSIIRSSIGKHSWQEAVENQDELQTEITKKLRETGGTLIKAGFCPEGIKFVLAHIDLPAKLKEALPLLDTERIRSEAAEFTTKAEEQEREFLKKVMPELAEKLKEAGYTQEAAQKVAFDTLQDYLAATKKGNLQKVVWNGTGGGISEIAALWELGKRMPMGKASGQTSEQIFTDKDEDKRKKPREELIKYLRKTEEGWDKKKEEEVKKK